MLLVSRPLGDQVNEQRHATTTCDACGQRLPIKAGPLLCADCEQAGRRTPASVYAKQDKRPLCATHGYESWVTGRRQ